MLNDLGSKNGTVVAGKPIRGSVPLASGDSFQIGLLSLRVVAIQSAHTETM